MADPATAKDVVAHEELHLPPTTSKSKFSAKSKDGDVALALFNDSDELLNEPITPEEEARLVRKVDWLILPLIAVNYAFFYIDKTTLSYAAIFGIREDLDLAGMRYSWASSIFVSTPSSAAFTQRCSCGFAHPMAREAAPCGPCSCRLIKPKP